MKSSTVFLRDVNNRIIGAICINFDISDLSSFHRSMGEFLDFLDSSEHYENFPSNVQDAVERMVAQILTSYNNSPDRMNLEEKLECISAMQEKGIFLIKGSVEHIAGIFGISKFTIYGYLSKVRSDELENKISKLK